MEECENIFTQLENQLNNDNFEEIQEKAASELLKNYSADELLEPIFKLMEKYPLADWGMPGALAEIAESANEELYEKCLLESIKRQPTLHTVWLLNRYINSVPDAQKARLILVMRSVADNEELPKAIRDSAGEFIDYLENSRRQSAKSVEEGFGSLSDIFSSFNFTPKK